MPLRNRSPSLSIFSRRTTVNMATPTSSFSTTCHTAKENEKDIIALKRETIHDSLTSVSNKNHPREEINEESNPFITYLNGVLFSLSDAPDTKRRKRKQPSSSYSTQSSNQQNNSTATSDSHASYAPPGLEKEFHELYSTLAPCLVERTNKANVAAVLMGKRGSGKSMLLERCLTCLQEEVREQQRNECQNSNNNQDEDDSYMAGRSMFRIVTLNGLMVRGDHVGFCVREIVQQLSDIAEQQHRQRRSKQPPKQTTAAATDADDYDTKDNDTEYNANTTTDNDKSTHRCPPPTLEKWLRLRKNFSFTSNLSLLDETLRLACVDQTPILIVLEEVDAFVLGNANTDILSGSVAKEGIEKSQRPVLLYHLLDRIATQGTLVSLVGMTSSLTALQTLEKRVKSRADGTTKIIHVQPQSASYQTLVNILMSKFDEGDVDEDNKNNDKVDDFKEDLKQRLANFLSGSVATHGDGGNATDPPEKTINNHSSVLIQQIMERHYRLGKDIRWFCRVLYIACSLYRDECVAVMKQKVSHNHHPPHLNSKHLMQALATMGASIPTTADRTTTSPPSVVEHGDARLQALLDLSQPQVALLLAARRILARDAIQEQQVVKPLTLDRMLQEYESFRGSGQRFSRPLLIHAFRGMFETNVFRPSADHSGSVTLQYLHQDQLYHNMDTNTFCRLPLHLTVEIDRELKVALDQNLLDCPTALREWGRNTN